MQNNLIKIQDGTIYRILQERDSEWLVIDCIKRTMPKWIESLAEFESVPESVLWVTNYTEMYLKGGEVTVAYNPDSVSDVWLIDNGEYVKF